MKVCFVQKQVFPYIGVMALSGALKANGFSADVLIDNSEKDLVGALVKMAPEVIGFSVLSTEHNWMKALILRIKEKMPGVLIAVGGVHATLYPGDVLNLTGVDYVCCGEGEIVLPELMKRLQKGERSAKGIAGIGYKENGKEILQGVAPLVEDLDMYVEDREIYYDRYQYLRDLSQKQFMSSRGCPFICTFCANKYVMGLYPDKTKYSRKKDPKKFLKEIKNIVEKYGVESMYFNDDLFIMNVKWLEEFAYEYKKQIGIPYMCSGRVGVINERIVKILSETGCHTMTIGLETGNEKIRKEILKKNITDAEIIKCAKMIKDSGIRLQTSNMFCLPDETFESAVSTIKLNMKIKSDFMFTTILLPFPKTELAEYCIKKGILDPEYSFDNMPESFVLDSVLTIKDKEKIINLHKTAFLCLKFPWASGFLMFMAKNIKFPALFFLLYGFSTFLRYKEERNISYLETLKLLWMMRKSY